MTALPDDLKQEIRDGAENELGRAWASLDGILTPKQLLALLFELESQQKRIEELERENKSLTGKPCGFMIGNEWCWHPKPCPMHSSKEQA